MSGRGENVKKPTIYITRRIPEDVIKPYKEKFNISMWDKEDIPIPKQNLMEVSKKADGLLCMLSDQIDESFLQANQHLKVVSNLAVGYDNIDVATAKQFGIHVTNTPDVLTDTTADLTFALLMATARRVVEANDFIKADKWENWAPYLLAGADIHHKTVGIVGMGRIGEAVAKRAKGFDMKILYHNRARKLQAEKELGVTYSSLDELLSTSDFVVSVVPLTQETNQLFNSDAFSKMKDSSIFINVSRGAVVDETALYDALKDKKIKAAGLDVFEHEPIRANHPLLSLENVVCLPHIGSASIETRTSMVQLCFENFIGCFYGDGPKTPVQS